MRVCVGGAAAGVGGEAAEEDRCGCGVWWLWLGAGVKGAKLPVFPLSIGCVGCGPLCCAKWLQDSILKSALILGGGNGKGSFTKGSCGIQRTDELCAVL
jgi:hypothetical protein